MRAPPASNKPTIGARAFIAMSWILMIFCACVSDSDPPNTVKSLAKANTVRPLTVPQPVTTPSPGILVFSMPNSPERCSTNMSNSSNVPLSISSSTRSRAVSLPRWCCASMRALPPPSRARARRASSLSMMSFMASPGPRISDSLARWRPSGAQQLHHARRRPHLGLAIGAALERDLVAAPLRHVPVLVDVRGGPGLRDRKPAGEESERNQRRAGERGDRMGGAEPPDVARDGGTSGGERNLRLGNVYHPCPRAKLRAERVARPGHQRIPGRLLPADQPLRGFGTIEDEIGGEILLHLRRHRVRRVSDAVDDRVGKPRERHGRGIDVFALRAPFLRERLPQRPGRGSQRPVGRRLHGAAIQGEVKAGLPLHNRNLLIEAPPQPRPHGLASRRVRIEGLFFQEVFKDFAHGNACQLAHKVVPSVNGVRGLLIQVL